MDIYWLSAVLIIGLYPLTRRLKKPNKVYCIAITIFLICVLGLRDAQNVGVDLIRYSKTYDELKVYTLNQYFNLANGSQVYYLLNTLFKKAGFSFQFFAFSLAFFELYIIGRYIYKYSSNPMLSFLVVAGMGCYTFLFSGLRQGVAMAILLLCFDAMLHKQWIKFCVLTVLAIGFHPTAIIMIPFFLLTRLRFSKPLLFVYTILIAIFVIFRVQIGYLLTSFYNQKYLDHYTSIIEIGGSTVFCLGITIAYFVLCYEKIKVKNSLEFYLAHGIIFLSLIQICSSYAYLFTRLNLYFQLMIMTIALPYLAKQGVLKKKFGTSSQLVQIGIVAVCTVIMVYQFNGHIDGELIRNYQFFWA